MDTLPAFSELYSVSDLHLGGQPGYQIFNQGTKLGALVDWIAARSKNGRVVLVVNGDIVDFLAESNGAYLDVARAGQILSRIMDDPAFAPVFAAFGRFVHTPGCHLVMVLGNHDVELALPPVRRLLTERLCGKDEAATSRLTLSLDGLGYTCRVGETRVLCMHGNEVDPWNVLNYEALRRISVALIRQRPPAAWTPNAGTRLVVDIMNDVKVRYPFVDLLKPETSLVPRVLLALDKSLLKELVGFSAILGGLLAGTARVNGFLAADSSLSEALPESDPGLAAELLLGDPAARRMAPDAAGHALMQQVERDFQRGMSAADLMNASDENTTLGMGSYLWETAFKDIPPDQALRQALQEWMAGDQTFAVDRPDTTFKQIDAAVSPTIDFVVTGHTHLERALKRSGGGSYFNTGTWIRLMYLSEALLSTQEAFDPVYRALTAGTMAAIDAVPGLVKPLHTVARIRDLGRSGVVGDLCHVDQVKDAIQLNSVEKSAFTRRQP